MMTNAAITTDNTPSQPRSGSGVLLHSVKTKPFSGFLHSHLQAEFRRFPLQARDRFQCFNVTTGLFKEP